LPGEAHAVDLSSFTNIASSAAIGRAGGARGAAWHRCAVPVRTCRRRTSSGRIMASPDPVTN